MGALEDNITSIYGELGKAWLQSLPEIINGVAQQYSLSVLKPLSNLSYHCVLSGLQGRRPIILKLGLDIDELGREAAALKAFSGFGAARVFAEGAGFLLLEHAIPGYSLKSSSSETACKNIKIACNVIRRLHGAHLSPSALLLAKRPSATVFPNIQTWLTILDQEWDIPTHYLRKARKLRDQLLTTATKPALLHGDLHRANILRNNDDWVVIDPKGVIAPPIYEVCAMISDVEQDTAFIANFFEFKLTEVKDWYFVYLILATCWALEDQTDPTLFMQRAEKVFTIVS